MQNVGTVPFQTDKAGLPTVFITGIFLSIVMNSPV